MKIKEWTWRNVKSYGNITQKIEFRQDKGELILLLGENGEGKTSCLDVIDLLMFGEILNKRGKRLSQKQIPNRTNGDAWAKMKLSTAQYEDVEITRTINPTLKTSLVVDGDPYTKAGKIQGRIEEIIQFDMDSFKSFISLNVNIFKDFINLTPEDKRIILDKLFNLQIINDLNKILKGMKQQNDLQYTSINKEILIYEEQIDQLKEAIEEAIVQIKINNAGKIDALKEELVKHKDAFIEIETTKDAIAEELSQISSEISKLSQKRNELGRDLREVQKQIDLYDQGKCPTCSHDLSIELDIKSDLAERKRLTLELIAELDRTMQESQATESVAKGKFNEASKKWTDLMVYLGGLKSQIKSLKAEQEANDKDGDDQTDIFKKNMEKAAEKLELKRESFIEIQKLKLIHDTLLPIWGESGVKRDIIEEIIGPINQYIQEDLAILGSAFSVEVDNNFDAHILEWGTEIDSDTLSTGEAKRINLVIMLAYIKMIRLKKDVNILILDELFASVDIRGVDFILQLMKKYANERNINIIIVHHSELNRALFDRILTVKKNHYSFITDERLTD